MNDLTAQNINNNLKRLADVFDGGDDCTDNVLDNLELIRTWLIFMSREEKRIADALERISPPQWEVCDISFDSAQINVMAEDGWTLFHVFEASFGTTAVLRRPRQAPAEGD